MKLYYRYFAIQLQSQMEHRRSFFLLFFLQALASALTFFTVFLLFDRFHQVDEFTLEQVMLCSALLTMSFSLAECVARGFDRFPRMLGNGTFDRILVRPRGEIFQVLATEIDLTRLGKLFSAVLLLLYALPRSGVHWHWDIILTIVLMVLSGTAIFISIFILYAALSFFTTEGLEVVNILTNGAHEFGAYPFSIYGKHVLRFVTYIIPLALFQYYPLLYVLGLSKNRLYMVLPVIGMVFSIPCFLLWRVGVRRYRSTGS